MAKHWIAWCPTDELAYRGATKAEAMLRARHAQFGKVPKWHQMQVDGWRVDEVEAPEPTAVSPPPASPARTAGRRSGR